jgi:tetratricopeptide (TPR) repeat protein
MKRKLLTTCGTILLVLLVMATGRAQMSQTPPPSSAPPQSSAPSGQLPTGQLPGAGAPAAQAAPPVDKDEEAAYKAFYDAHGPDPTHQIQLGEDFVKKYPASRYLPVVYSSLALDYLGSGDSDKMLAAAQDSINLDPDNVDALSLYVWAMARKVSPQDPSSADEFVKLQNYGHHAITLISTMTKPVTMDDAQFTAAKNDKLSMCHSGLGLIAFKQGKADEAVAEITQAVQLANSPDPVDYFILGHAYEAVSRFDDAVNAFMKCSDDGPMQDRCKAGLDDAKKKALLAPPPAASPTPAPAAAPPKS